MANKGRRLPQLPTERPLPELPSNEVPYSHLPTKTPPPSRRYFTGDHNDAAPPPIPPLSTIPKSNSAYFNRDRISLPDSVPSQTTQAPPLPPRKASVPAFTINDTTYDSPRPIDTCLYNVPKSTSGYTTTTATTLPPSYDSLSAPPLPPPISAITSSSINNANTISYTAISDPMTLRELMDTHQHEFPLQVEVSAGYFGDSDSDTFSEGDRLNIHFIKQVSVAVCESGGYGHKVKIPINSVAQFSVLYNPNEDMKEALFGFTFKSVKDILAQKTLPKIVCATKQHSSSNSAHSVQVGELLLINEVKHGRFGGQSIICTSLGTNKQKRLPENCQGQFSTKPEDVKMFLPELTKNFPLPLRVVVVTQATPTATTSTSTTNSLPFAPSEIVSITCIDKEITLIATPIIDCEAVQESIMFDIPVDLEIMEVQIIVQTDSDNCEKLYVDTRQLLDSYDPSKLYKQVRVGKQDDIYYTSVREDQKNVGIELLASEAIYSEATAILTNSLLRNTKPTPSFKNKLQNSSQNSSSEQLPSMNSSSERLPSMNSSSEQILSMQANGPTHHERPLSSPVPVIVHDDKQSTSEKAPKSNGHLNEYYSMDVLKTSPSLSPAPSPVPYLGTSMQDVPVYMVSKFMSENAGQYDVNGIQSEMKEMRDTMNSLKLQLEALQKNMADLQNIVQDRTEYVEMMPSKNSKLLGMSCSEVLSMLDRLNLGQYKDKFKSECIDGTLLSELDEDTLRDELGITSKIHCKKLILVIQGKNTYQHLVQH